MLVLRELIADIVPLLTLGESDIQYLICMDIGLVFLFPEVFKITLILKVSILIISLPNDIIQTSLLLFLSAFLHTPPFCILLAPASFLLHALVPSPSSTPVFIKISEVLCLIS